MIEEDIGLFVIISTPIQALFITLTVRGRQYSSRESVLLVGSIVPVIKASVKAFKTLVALSISETELIYFNKSLSAKQDRSFHDALLKLNQAKYRR